MRRKHAWKTVEPVYGIQQCEHCRLARRRRRYLDRYRSLFTDHWLYDRQVPPCWEWERQANQENFDEAAKYGFRGLFNAIYGRTKKS